MYDLQGKKVFVAGHKGMVGSAIVRRLQREDCEILTADRDELDLRDQAAVKSWFADRRPQTVFLAAAKVGGILANSSFPAEFLHDNLAVQTNVIGAAHSAAVEKLLFLGSSCIYPKFAAQPIKEEALLTGSLESTNEWYAIAKIAGLKLVEAYRRQYGVDFISVMPTNLYGPGDNFHLESSHVIPALIRKFYNAKAKDSDVVLWGSGHPKREFLYVDDCADACVYLMNVHSGVDWVNVGTGMDISIKDLALLIGAKTGYGGEVTWDKTKPDGTPRKLLDISKLTRLGWRAKVSLSDGLSQTCQWYHNLLYRDPRALRSGAFRDCAHH